MFHLPAIMQFHEDFYDFFFLERAIVWSFSRKINRKR